MQEISKRPQIQSDLLPWHVMRGCGFLSARFSRLLKPFFFLSRIRKRTDSGRGISVGQIAGSGAESYTPLHAIELLDETDACLVDLRPKREFAAVRVRGALHAPEEALEEMPARQSVNPDRVILCLCRDGSTSAQAAEKLQGMGYHRAGYILGGMKQWQREGLPVLKGKRI